MKTINLDKLNEVITIYGLKNKSRDRSLVWNRAAVYKFLRDNGFSLDSIGKMFGKNHATVINGLKIYSLNERYNDFQSYIMPIENELVTTFHCHINESNDICQDEMISLAYLETLISEKL